MDYQTHNIALIGYGYWGSKLYRYLKENKNFKLKYVYTPSAKNLPEYTAKIADIWQDEKVKAVTIATPINTHYQIVKQALQHGKHVFSEKPLTTKTSECSELKKMAQKQKRILAVDYTWTFSQALKKAQEINIGSIKVIEMEIKQLGRFKKGDVHWLLTSHLLSVLDLFVPLKTLSFQKIDLFKNRGLTETSLLLFKNKNLKGKISVSLNCPEKEIKIIIYGAKGTIIYNPLLKETLKIGWYKKSQDLTAKDLIIKKQACLYDEMNNLKQAVEFFHQTLTGKAKTNINRAIEVTRIIEKLGVVNP